MGPVSRYPSQASADHGIVTLRVKHRPYITHLSVVSVGTVVGREFIGHEGQLLWYQGVVLLLLLMTIHTFSVLALQVKKLRVHNESAMDLLNINPARGHKEVRRLTGHIMVTTR